MTRTFSTPETMTTLVPSELKAARVSVGRTIPSLGLASAAISRPDCVAQILTVRSLDDAVTMYDPLGLNWALLTSPLCALKTVLCFPSDTPQILTVPSREAVSSDRPS